MKLLLAATLALSLASTSFVATPLAQAQSASASKPTGVLAATEVQQLMPQSVFFSGQSATVQVRNSGAVRFGNGGLVLAGLVDTGGYSTSVREKYQLYVLADTPIKIAGKRFAPGSYGAGFVGGSFLLLDLGANEIFRAAVTRDAALQRPRPLQIVAGKAGEYRLYVGREYITIQQAE